MAKFITGILEFWIMDVLLVPVLVIAGIVIVTWAIRYHDSHRKVHRRKDMK